MHHLTRRTALTRSLTTAVSSSSSSSSSLPSSSPPGRSEAALQSNQSNQTTANTSSTVQNDRAKQTKSTLEHPYHTKPWFQALTPAKQWEFEIGRPVGVHSALVRFWDFPQSLPDAMAVIRAIEAKYGRLLEWKYLRDANRHTAYQIILRVRFASPASVERIAPESDVMHIVLPPLPSTPSESSSLSDSSSDTADSTAASPTTASRRAGKGTDAAALRRPGGIGLAELQGLMDPADLTDFGSEEWQGEGVGSLYGAAREEGARMIDLKISRGQYETFTLGQNTSQRLPHHRVAQSFLQWGGFAPLKPIPKDAPILPRSWSLTSTAPTSTAKHVIPTDDGVDHPHMRLALRKWSEVSGVRNPWEEAWVPIEDPVQESTESRSKKSRDVKDLGGYKDSDKSLLFDALGDIGSTKAKREKSIGLGSVPSTTSATSSSVNTTTVDPDATAPPNVFGDAAPTTGSPLSSSAESASDSTVDAAPTPEAPKSNVKHASDADKLLQQQLRAARRLASQASGRGKQAQVKQMVQSSPKQSQQKAKPTQPNHLTQAQTPQLKPNQKQTPKVKAQGQPGSGEVKGKVNVQVPQNQKAEKTETKDGKGEKGEEKTPDGMVGRLRGFIGGLF